MTTIQSAIHTARAVIRKGKADIRVTKKFLTDPEMIKLYQALWQALYGLGMLMYGLGVLSRRQMDALVEASLTPEQDESEVSENDFKMETYVSDWKTDLIPILVDTFRNEFTVREKAQVLRSLGLPYRVRSRRFNSEELTAIYKQHLEAL